MSTAPIESPGEIEGVVRASELERTEGEERREVEWARSTLEGRLGELSGSGAASPLSWTMRLVRTSQSDGEPVAWVTTGGGLFFPPDLRRNGIDLEGLPVVRLEETREAARAADKLLRSGGFGLIVVDLRSGASPAEASSGRSSSDRIPRALQKRLAQHADDHGAAVLFLTEKRARAPSLGALVSFRAQTERKRKGTDRFECELRTVADNRFGPGWTSREVYRGPPGLR